MTARAAAIARSNQEIEASTARAVATRAAEGPRRMSAMEAISMDSAKSLMRLNIAGRPC